MKRDLPTSEPRKIILKWGRVISAQFKVDNTHLIMRQADTSTVQVAEAIANLGTLIADMKRMILVQQQQIIAQQLQLLEGRFEGLTVEGTKGGSPGSSTTSPTIAVAMEIEEEHRRSC